MRKWEAKEVRQLPNQQDLRSRGPNRSVSATLYISATESGTIAQGG